MSDDSNLIQSENVPKFLSVGFVLTLLAVVLGLFGTLRSFTLEAALRKSHDFGLESQKTADGKIAALEAKVAALEAASSAAATPAAPAADPAAPAADPAAPAADPAPAGAK